MKKIVIALLTLVVSMILLVGCSNQYHQILIGEWTTDSSSHSADITFMSDGTYYTGAIKGTWSITNDGILTGQYNWNGTTNTDVSTIEIIDDDTIKMQSGAFPMLLYRVSNTAPEEKVITPMAVTSANSTAASIQNVINSFLADCDANGYGMNYYNAIEITISVNDGIWTVTNNYTDAFNNGSFSWQGSGLGYAGATRSHATSAEELLAIELCELFPTTEYAYIKAYLNKAECAAVVFVDDVSTMPAGIPEWWDFEYDNFKWSGIMPGTTAEYLIVGTSPVLD